MAAARNASPQRSHATLDAFAEPLGMSHQFYLADVVANIAPDWSVELYATGPDSGTIVVMPHDADDDIGPTYFVHLEGGALCLDQLHWDCYSSVGRFADLGGVAEALRRKLSSPATLAMPRSRTLH